MKALITFGVLLEVGWLITLGWGVLYLAQPRAVAAQQQLRVDTFDKLSNRTGYAVVDPKTGRVDFYDKDSNRTGSGQVTPPAPQPQPSPQPQPGKK